MWVNPGEQPTGMEAWSTGDSDPLWDEFDALERRRMSLVQVGVSASLCLAVALSLFLMVWIHRVWEQGLASLARFG